MKLSKKYIYGLFIIAFSFMVTMCMTIEDVRIITDNPYEGRELVIEVDISMVAENDGVSGLVFGMLAPRLWDIRNTATVHLKTTAADPANVYDGPLTVISPSAENPKDGMPWGSSFQSRFGVQDNSGPVEWVAFETPDFKFDINDKVESKKHVTGTVTITFVPNTAIRCYLGFTYAGREFGYDGEFYKENIRKREIIVDGLDILDYGATPRVSHIPSTFGYGDIFSIRYNEFDEFYALKGQDAYLWAEADYVHNGTVHTRTVDVISDKTKMELVRDDDDMTTWSKYIYPPEFFDLPAGATIIEFRVHFTNADKSIIVMDEDEDEGTVDEFYVEETCN